MDQPLSGGGEELMGPAAAAIANAFFDATGALA
jgi:CO/xanthine dehydrogenase Mo-binding subunit